jgi:hypothetical protein
MELEQKILNQVNDAIQKSIAECLGKYDSPLNVMAKNVVNKHAQEIEVIMDEALTGTIKSNDFQKAVREVFTHKLAKTLMAKMEGEVEKATTIFKQDPTRRAKVILAIEKIINEETTPKR